MRDKLAAQLTKSGHLSLIRAAAAQGRPTIQSILSDAPTPTIAHFLYKSRANVQFCMSSLATLSPSSSSPSPSPPPQGEGRGGGREGGERKPEDTILLLARRRLMSIYHDLHAAAHVKHAHLRAVLRRGPERVARGYGEGREPRRAVGEEGGGEVVYHWRRGILISILATHCVRMRWILRTTHLVKGGLEKNGDEGVRRRGMELVWVWIFHACLVSLVEWVAMFPCCEDRRWRIVDGDQLYTRTRTMHGIGRIFYHNCRCYYDYYYSC
jgi:hypothetical protein